MIEVSAIGLVSAFVAGAISFLSPCVLPLVPGYVSYIAGRAASERATGGTVVMRLPAVGLSLCFVLGFSTVFVTLGASATALSQIFLSYRYELNIVGGTVVVIFGLLLVGLLRLPWLMREARFHLTIPGGRPVSAYVLGLAFAFGWTPCIGPILGAILTMSAASTTVAGGTALLAIYSFGLGVPFLIAAIFTTGLTARLKAMSRVGRLIQVGAGGIMVVMGIAMVTGQLSAFAYWLLNALPILARIG